MTLQWITRVWADKWGVWLSGLQCYLEAAMCTCLLCRWWRQVTAWERENRGEKSVWRAERDSETKAYWRWRTPDKKIRGGGLKSTDTWCVRHVLGDRESFFFFLHTKKHSYIQTIKVPHPIRAENSSIWGKVMTFYSIPRTIQHTGRLTVNRECRWRAI